MLGFAETRVEAPFADQTWEIWGCNNVFAYVPRVDVTFELHKLLNLGNRRHAEYFDWMAKGCPSGPRPTTPIFMIEPRPEWPTSQRFPFEKIQAIFQEAHGTDYWTSSIAWMLASAIHELTVEVTVTDESGGERKLRIAAPGAELSLYGINMSADSEYASQRPAVEYYLGIARGMGIPVFIPPVSDLCKSSAVYGLGTTAPLAIKARAMIEQSVAAKQPLLQRQAQMQQEQLQIQYQLGSFDGQKETWKYIERIYTQPTDIVVGAVLPEKDRGEPMSGAPLALNPAVVQPSDGQVPVEAGVSIG